MTEVRRLDWDSRFFGIPIGRIDFTSETLNPVAIEAVLREAKNLNIACLYLQLPFASPEVTAFCARPDFLLVDVKTVLSMPLAPETALDNSGPGIVPPADAHGSVLEAITENISRTSRFRFDPHFGEAGAARLYRTWLHNSLSGGFVSDFLVAAANGRPEGFVTLRNKEGMPHIDLLGVSEDARGRGIGSRLITAAAVRAKAEGSRRLDVVTQGHNVAALRAYQTAGFRIVSSNPFYHVWMEP